ncbi:MAG: CoA-binding protein, partial [Burkholderiales bacterium]|nr:CoA-binding protein [Anaerolineae bacterium]
VRRDGEVIGEMALLEEAPRMATVRARCDSVLLAIPQDLLEHLLNNSPSAARSMLHTITARWRATEALLRQSEKMAQLGTLTAGMAHELNNPTAAIQRGAGQLRRAVSELQQIEQRLHAWHFDGTQLAVLTSLDDLAKERAAQPLEFDALARSDAEAELENWLQLQGINSAWEIAPTLVSLGYTDDGLAALVDGLGDEAFGLVISWLDATYSVYTLLESVWNGAGRVAEIVKALKTYIFLDQAPVQAVDVHDGLDNTLAVLSTKLTDVTVNRDYASRLPRIQAYGSELNQVWTNLLDNAADALMGIQQSAISLRTSIEGEAVVVEIEDNGSGIPDAVQTKIFDPFFTTKPPGMGTGLGLSTAYNIIVQKHRGEITAYSQPGKTVFRVKLPFDFEMVNDGMTPVAGVQQAEEERIRRILQTTQTIAVVGMSSHEDRPANTIPAYLQTHGYRIIPVNPTIESVLGEKAYPDLSAVTERVDTVLIFRPREAVPPIVEQAIEIGARAVWMQEGIINEEAAQTARDSGLDVVMDRCMRVEHKRLF